MHFLLFRAYLYLVRDRVASKASHIIDTAPVDVIAYPPTSLPFLTQQQPLPQAKTRSTMPNMHQRPSLRPDTEESIVLPLPVYKLIMTSLEDDAQQQDVTLSMEIEESTNEVRLTLKGSGSNVKKAKDLVSERSKKTTQGTVEVEEKYSLLLEEELAMQELKRCIISRGFTIDIKIENKKLKFIALEKEGGELIKYIQQLFDEEILPLDDSNRQFVIGQQWRTQQMLMEKSKLVKIIDEPNHLTVYGFKHEVLDTKDKLDELLKGKNIEIQNVEIPDDAEFRYIDLHMRKDITNIVEDESRWDDSHFNFNIECCFDIDQGYCLFSVIKCK